MTTCQTFILLFRQSIAIVALLWSLQLPAQTPRLKFKHISTEQGLSNTTVEAIVQDKRGFIWIGTRDGLNRYDGGQLVIYRFSATDSNSISDNYVTYIYEDSRHALWIGTTNGLNRFDPQKNHFTRFRNKASDKNSLSHNYITCILEDRAGKIWVSTAGGGINLFNPQQNSFVSYRRNELSPASLNSNFVNTMYEDRQGNFWVGTDKGIQSFDPATTHFRSVDIFPGGQSFSIRIVKEDKTGNLLLGTNDQGLILLNNKLKTAKLYQHNESQSLSLSTNLVRSICVGKNGDIWLGSVNGGLSLFDPVSEKFFNYQNRPDDPLSLSQRTASALFEDNQGNLWVGTHRGGVNLYMPNTGKFMLYRQQPDKNSLSYNDVKAFCEDKNGFIWIGTDGGGLNLFDKQANNFTHFKYNPADNNSLGSNEVIAILEDKDGELWVGTWGGGLCRYNAASKNFSRYRHNARDTTSISSDYVQIILEDSKQNIWVATYFAGLNLFDKKTKRFKRVLKSRTGRTNLNGNNIISLMEDRTGNLWIGTDDGGLNKLNAATGEFEHYFNSEDKKPDLRILFTDSKGRVWVGQSGLYLYDKAKNNFSLFTDKAGLAVEFIKGMTEDNKGNFWIATSNGIVQLNPETLSTRKYNTSDGLQGLEFEANAYLKTRDGMMLFGGVNGFNAFYPDEIVPNNFVPPVFVTDFQVQNKKVIIDDRDNLLDRDISFTNEIVLSHKQTTFSFGFAALNYTASENNHFSYKLENWDKNWVDAGSEKKASYINVRPGNYTFYVKASNNDGVWNEKGYAIKITIKPPFWQTWWFRTLAAALILAGAFYFYRIRRKIQLQKFEEEKKEELHQLQLQFFTNISHEFRTPLSLISGPVDKLLKEDPLPKNKHAYQVIQRNANRLLQLINELMDFRKAESGVLRLQVMPGNIPVFLEEISEEFSELAIEKNINFTVSDMHTAQEVWFDRQVLEKVIVNLLSNSFKYTPDNGAISLTFFDSLQGFTPSFENELIIKNSYTGKQYIYVRIADNGIGISKESINHLFERYYRVSDSHLGSGIGLAFVKNLTQLHKGSIYVYSERNKGTEIIIAIPCDKTDYDKKEKWVLKNDPAAKLESLAPIVEINKQEPAIATSVKEQRKKPGNTILIVDDNDELRNFLRESLEGQYAIIEATEGKMAMEKTTEFFPDAIVSDIMMPVMNGVSYCKLVKENAETSHIPFIMLTAKDGIDSRLEVAGIGADYYFSKPVSMELLQLTLRNIFSQKQKLREKYQHDYNADVKDLAHSSKDKEFIEELIHILEDSLQKPEMDIEYICTRIGMSRTKLYNKIKNITGQSISDFVRTIRLRKAAQLMAHKETTITEVMYSVGIQTQSYFTKAFKNEFGKTPSQFLKDLDKKKSDNS